MAIAHQDPPTQNELSQCLSAPIKAMRHLQWLRLPLALTNHWVWAVAKERAGIQV